MQLLPNLEPGNIIDEIPIQQLLPILIDLISPFVKILFDGSSKKIS